MINPVGALIALGMFGGRQNLSLKGSEPVAKEVFLVTIGDDNTGHERVLEVRSTWDIAEQRGEEIGNRFQELHPDLLDWSIGVTRVTLDQACTDADLDYLVVPPEEE